MTAYHIHYYVDMVNGIWHTSETIWSLPPKARKVLVVPIEIWVAPGRDRSWAKIHRKGVECPKGWVLP
jgi:hypothetical protein